MIQIQENPEVESQFFTNFQPLPKAYEEAFICEDYLPDSQAKKLINIFRKKSTNKKREENKAERKKKRLSKRDKKKKDS